MTPRCIVLSGSIGTGHDSVAQACSRALVAGSIEPSVVDCMSSLGTVGGFAADRAFRGLLAVAPVYDAFHFSFLRAGSKWAERSSKRATKRLVEALATELGADEVVDVVAVFATGAGLMDWIAQRRPQLGRYVVVPDATAHRIWIAAGVQRYIVFSEITAGTVRQYDPHADVAVIDPPVREEFIDPPCRSTARANLTVDDRDLLVLVMGGGWGRGPLAEIAEHLARGGCSVIALTEPAKSVSFGHDRVRYLGRRGDVATLMAAADVVVTSPGQACHEARAVGRRLVVVDSVPGHGRENLLAEVNRGAFASRATPQAVKEAVLATLRRMRDDPLAAPPIGWNKQFLRAIERG